MQAAHGSGAPAWAPTSNAGFLRKAVTLVQHPRGDFWVSSVSFVHEIGLNARAEKFLSQQ